MLAHLARVGRVRRQLLAACYVNDRLYGWTSGVKSGRQAANKSALIMGCRSAATCSPTSGRHVRLVWRPVMFAACACGNHFRRARVAGRVTALGALFILPTSSLSCIAGTIVGKVGSPFFPCLSSIYPYIYTYNKRA